MLNEPIVLELNESEIFLRTNLPVQCLPRDETMQILRLYADY